MAYLATGGTAMSTASAAVAVAKDPYLPEVVGLVLKLQSIEKKEAGTSGGTGTGVGLRNVVGPLRTFVKIQEKPWVLPVAVVGIVSTIFAAGYFTRKVTRG